MQTLIFCKDSLEGPLHRIVSGKFFIDAAMEGASAVVLNMPTQCSRQESRLLLYRSLFNATCISLFSWKSLGSLK